MINTRNILRNSKRDITHTELNDTEILAAKLRRNSNKDLKFETHFKSQNKYIQDKLIRINFSSV